MIDPDLMLRMVRSSPVIAFDTETSGLDFNAFVCGWVVTDEQNSLYTPVRHEAGGNIPNAVDFEHELADAFAERTRLGLLTVGHHLGFDLRKSLQHGVVIAGPVECTMLNQSLIDDTTIGYSLDECTKRAGVKQKLGDDLYRAIANRFGGMPDRKSMANYWRMPGDEEVVIEYATGDGDSTLALWRYQQPLLDESNLRKPQALENKLMPYLARAHLRGMKVDHEYANQVEIDLKNSIEAEMRKFTPGFNVRSPKEVEALYRAQGYTDAMFAYTEPSASKPKGQVSFTEKWLETNELGRDILTIRQLENASSKFIQPIISKQNYGGFIHPVLHQSKSDDFGVAGARLSCSEPNMQAQPKRNKKIGKIVRPLIIPSQPGWLIEEADAMQQEPRFFTHYSQEPALLYGYRTGTMDIHDRASEMLHLERDYAKRLGLGMLTMMQPKALAGHLSVPLSEAKSLHARFLTDAFPRINDFQQLAIRTMRNRGYVRSILGRIANLDGPAWTAYVAVSRIIQNSGGDHMKTCLLRAFEWEDAYPDLFQILLSIHDSVIWQRDPGHDITEVVRRMENVVHEPDFSLSVPIPFEIGSGLNWSEASYGKKIKDKQGWVLQ